MLKILRGCCFLCLLALMPPARFEARGQEETVGRTPCPAAIMFDGVAASKDANEAKARYWAEEVGIDGFLLNNVMAAWDTTVPDLTSPAAADLKHFSEIYAAHGIDQNFIKVAIYHPLDWKDSAARARDVENFRLGAQLARFAGLRGMALDLESYAKGFWETDATNPAKAETAYEMGKAIGEAIERGYPGSPVFIVREVLWWQSKAPNYALSGRFWDGFVSSSVPHIYVGEELTYDLPNIPPELIAMYRENAIRNHVNPSKVEIIPGLWPLGHSYTDKSPRISASVFGDQLRAAFGAHARYVWIYGFGSAWETDGAYGKGPVTSTFREYTQNFLTIKAACRGRAVK